MMMMMTDTDTSEVEDFVVVDYYIVDVDYYIVVVDVGVDGYCYWSY